MENSRCSCCGNSQLNWGWGQNQGHCNSYDNSKNEGHKYCCCCWEEKQECGCTKSKENSKCVTSHSNNLDKGCNCGCSSKNQGYDNHCFGTYGQNGYYGW